MLLLISSASAKNYEVEKLDESHTSSFHKIKLKYTGFVDINKIEDDLNINTSLVSLNIYEIKKEEIDVPIYKSKEICKTFGNQSDYCYDEPYIDRYKKETVTKRVLMNDREYKGWWIKFIEWIFGKDREHIYKINIEDLRKNKERIFEIEWITPIEITSQGGYGSEGSWSLNPDGDWLANYNKRTAINITNNVDYACLVENTTYPIYLFDLVNDYDNTGFENNTDAFAIGCGGVEVNVDFENATKFGGVNSSVYFKSPHLHIESGSYNYTACYVYYDNTTSVTPARDNSTDNVWLWNENLTGILDSAWSVYGFVGGNPDINGTGLYLTGNRFIFQNFTSSGNNIHIEVKARADTTELVRAIFFRSDEADNDSYCAGCNNNVWQGWHGVYYGGALDVHHLYWNGTTRTNGGSPDYDVEEMIKYEINITNNNITFYSNETIRIAINSSNDTSKEGIGLWNIADHNFYNDIKIYRQYEFNPTVELLGTEEELLSINSSWLTVSGFDNSTLNRELTIDFINLSIGGRNSVAVNVTIPDGSLAVDSANMTNSTLALWNYSNNFDLNQTGSYTLTFYMFNNTDSQSRSFTFTSRDAIVDETTTWNQIVLEGSTQTFTTNVSYIDQGVSTLEGILVFNGTNYPATKSEEDSRFFFTRTITTPAIGTYSGDWNKTFYWNFTIYNDNGNHYFNQSSFYQQNYTTIAIDNCTDYEILAINFTLKDEDTQDTIPSNLTNSTIETDVMIYSPTDVDSNFTYHNVWINHTNPQICISNESINWYIDSTTSYVSEGRVKEYHYFDHFNLSNNSIPQNVNLYDLNENRSTSFLLRYYDCNYLNPTGAIIDINRYYVGDGLFRSVEMGMTDPDGQTRGHFVTEDIKYRFIVRQDGELLLTTPEYLAICQTVPCQINLYEDCGQGGYEDWTQTANLNHNLDLNETSRTITFTFSTTDGSTPEMRLNVSMFPFLNESVCDESITSSSGTLSCTIPLTFENYTHYVETTMSGQQVEWGFFEIEQTAHTYFGYTGLLMTALLVLSLALMGASTGIVAVLFFTVLGLIASSILLIIDLGWVSLTYVIVCAIIIMYKIARRSSTK